MTNTVNRVLLKKLQIQNLGPIKDDTVLVEPFTYFVGRNNAGKSHYLRALELLLAPKNPSAEEIFKLLNDKSRGILIEGEFAGVEHFTSLVTKSNHKVAIDDAIAGGVLRVARVLSAHDSEESVFGVRNQEGTIVNPSGFMGNLLKVLPEPISIFATADTIDELKSRGNTAIVKLKKEVLGSFLQQLKGKASEALAALNEYLHSQEEGKRSAELVQFENDLKEELVGEFVDIIPSVEFGLPDEQVIANEMKILLDDGYRSEVEQKGHGLQRGTLLALLRLLARRGEKYQNRPAPIFLIGELETFLHPYAQRQLAEALGALVDRYQIITTTHSPFIITPKFVEGYRRVKKDSSGTRNVMPRWDGLEVDAVRRHLEWRGNLEGLFADRIVLLEGSHDENFFERLRRIFAIPFPGKLFSLFVRTDGKKRLRIVRKFYAEMGYSDISVIADLDYLFSNDIKHLLDELQIDPACLATFRKHIGWEKDADPSLRMILDAIDQKGEPPGVAEILTQLQDKRVFVLRHGAPEQYLKQLPTKKGDFSSIDAESDLVHTDYLKSIMTDLLKQ